MMQNYERLETKNHKPESKNASEKTLKGTVLGLASISAAVMVLLMETRSLHLEARVTTVLVIAIISSIILASEQERRNQQKAEQLLPEQFELHKQVTASFIFTVNVYLALLEEEGKNDMVKRKVKDVIYELKRLKKYYEKSRKDMGVWPKYQPVFIKKLSERLDIFIQQPRLLWDDKLPYLLLKELHEELDIAATVSGELERKKVNVQPEKSFGQRVTRLSGESSAGKTTKSQTQTQPRNAVAHFKQKN